MNRVQIFDTTLRDGEQSPGVSLNAEEKLTIARQLERLGVDVIEAGFPAASSGDLAAVQAIAREVRAPVICALARAEASDIRAAWEGVRPAERPRIHTFISTSEIHITHQLRTTRRNVVGQARAAVAHARELCEQVQFSPMDATRSEPEFVAEVCAAALEEGASVLNIPDTVGYATPGEYAQLLRYLRTELFTEDEGVPEGITLAAHTHNDLGLAVANALAGLSEGARQVEVSVNGIGERAGNAALEEVVMLLETRRDALGYEHQINTFEIARTSRLVARHVGYPVAPNKAVVGRNAFAHESGIHQDGILKERSTYEIMDPRAIGLDSNEIVLGKHSGRHALADAYRKLGYELSGEQLRRLFADFKELADRKKRITSLDLEALLGDQLRAGGEIELRAWTLSAGSGRVPRAEVIIADAGCERRAAAEGDGPIDAVLAALASALGTQAELKHFEAQGVDEGSEALAEAGVVVEEKGRRASGQATAPDTVEAAARAYLRAVFALSHSA